MFILQSNIGLVWVQICSSVNLLNSPKLLTVAAVAYQNFGGSLRLIFRLLTVSFVKKVDSNMIDSVQKDNMSWKGVQSYDIQVLYTVT